MRFPGQRIAKHYFPVTGKARPRRADEAAAAGWTLVGLDQVLVDMEVETPAGFAEEMGIVRGESVQLDEPGFQRLVGQIERRGFPCRYAAGGTVANTLNNYVHLSGEPAVLLGAIQGAISPHDPAFRYVAQTPPAVDLTHLRAVDGLVGTAVTFIFPDGERSFAVAPGVSNELSPEDVPAQVVRSAAAVLTTLYTLIDPAWPIAAATRRLMTLANEADVPVAFGLGTAGLVRRMRDEVRELLRRQVTTT